MSYVRVSAFIGKDRDSVREVQFLVDTGAFYTMLPPELASDLGIETPLAETVWVADSRRIPIQLGIAHLRALDREGGVPVGVMEVPEPLMGVTALEALGLKVNPIAETLEYDRPYGPALLRVEFSDG
jgi:predicted aspartyl protease